MNVMKKNGKILLVIAMIAVVLVCYIVSKYVMSERLEELRLETTVLISEQETLISSIALTTARNGADEITERIIKDCSVSERTSFDELLSKLDAGLSRTQLIELERLFGRCGSFYAERKSVMVARLSREIEIFELLVTQLSNLTNTDKATEYNIGKWKELSDLELKQSNLFSELVAVQDSIITALLAGKSVNSDEMVEILQKAKNTQETLAVTNTQAATVRTVLVPL